MKKILIRPIATCPWPYFDFLQIPRFPICLDICLRPFFPIRIHKSGIQLPVGCVKGVEMFPLHHAMPLAFSSLFFLVH